ncbi:hypothetical protein [Acidithiobacillus thiooxidans]|uniref:Uncharacterized protein n=1 Tax=Acidithiobacillus thiooxidans TaxID=930 RepID=A0A1C2JGI1_ACITH|nr:hypothetical protein [Acidithiobacillus thiooxidans]OCX68493.1 hypothetical protein A6M23_18160 [Acidithiobacillus thiooxidans]OCX87360.1 hypothetical protein A6P08_03495 [Acidithiobacillus thiooxidans]
MGSSIQSRAFWSIVLSTIAYAGSVQGEDLPLWPLPEGFVSRPVAREMRLNGMPMRVDLIQGVGREEGFRQEMDRSCRREGGRFQQLPSDMGKELWSCIRAPYSQTLRWHRVGPRIEGESSVINWQAEAQKLLPILPLPGQTQLISDLETKDGALQGRVELLESSLSIAQMRAYLLRAAQERGWASDGMLSKAMGRLSLQKKGESLDMVFQAQPMGGSYARKWCTGALQLA